MTTTQTVLSYIGTFVAGMGFMLWIFYWVSQPPPERRDDDYSDAIDEDMV